MKTWVRRSLNVGVLSAGFLLVTGGAAQADWTTGNNAGVGSGNQLDNTVQLPINACGNAISVLGFADASCEGGASASNGGGGSEESSTTGYNAGALTGNQIGNTVQAPINLSGNAIAVGGFASGSSAGGASASNGGGGSEESSTTGYNAGVANGNQASTTVQVPINACGNSIALLGFADASCGGGASASNGGGNGGGSEEAGTTGNNAGALSGNQISTVLQAPINVCGNSIAVLGFASADCGGGADASNGGGSGSEDPDDDGDGDGSGDDGDDDGYDDGDGTGAGGDGYGTGAGSGSGYSNANGMVSGHGAATSTHHATKTVKSAKKAAKSVKKAGKAMEHGNGNGSGSSNNAYNGGGSGSGSNNGGGSSNGGGSAAGNGTCSDWTTGYNAGVLSGTQLGTVIQVPINVSGNALGLLGFTETSTEGGASATSC